MTKPEGENGFQPDADMQTQSQLEIIEKDPYSPEEIEARKQNAEERFRLADELCRKYEKGDEFNFHLEKRENNYQVILEDVQVGTLTIRNNGDTKQLALIMLNKNLQKKGFGKQLYIKLNNYFQKRDGSTLMTDTMRANEGAEGLWLSLVRDGLAEETPIETADGHKVYRFKKN